MKIIIEVFNYEKYYSVNEYKYSIINIEYLSIILRFVI